MPRRAGSARRGIVTRCRIVGDEGPGNCQHRSHRPNTARRRNAARARRIEELLAPSHDGLERLLTGREVAAGDGKHVDVVAQLDDRAGAQLGRAEFQREGRPSRRRQTAATAARSSEFVRSIVTSASPARSVNSATAGDRSTSASVCGVHNGPTSTTTSPRHAEPFAARGEDPARRGTPRAVSTTNTAMASVTCSQLSRAMSTLRPAAQRATTSTASGPPAPREPDRDSSAAGT